MLPVASTAITKVPRCTGDVRAWVIAWERGGRSCLQPAREKAHTASAVTPMNAFWHFFIELSASVLWVPNACLSAGQTHTVPPTDKPDGARNATDSRRPGQAHKTSALSVSVCPLSGRSRRSLRLHHAPELAYIEFVVCPLFGEQLLVCPPLHNPPVLDEQHLVGVPDRAQPVGNDEAGASPK